MDEDEFEKTLDGGTVEHLDDDLLTPRRSHEHSAFARGSLSATPRERVRRELLGGNRGEPGITWIRASDLLSSGSGRVAGRGLDFETEAVRRLRRSTASTRRAIRERADQLPPLSAFGRSPAHPMFVRHDLGRR